MLRVIVFSKIFIENPISKCSKQHFIGTMTSSIQPCQKIGKKMFCLNFDFLSILCAPCATASGLRVILLFDEKKMGPI